MTKLSVNLNKIALIRNSRETSIPCVVAAAETVIAAGAQGITVHPRPDMRHIRPDDVRALSDLLARPEYQHIEFNIEGNPYAVSETNGYPGFMALVTEIQPHQVTLVPDTSSQLTSDHGWELSDEWHGLEPVVDKLKSQQIRVSLFMDPDPKQISLAAKLSVDRIEYYTGPYAAAFPHHQEILRPFIETASLAFELGLGINAGHDLNLQNLEAFIQQVPHVVEVSIGHGIIADALWMGLTSTILQYRAIMSAKQ